MTINRYDMTIPVRVVSVLHSGGIDSVPERPITDDDGRTAQPNAFARNGIGEAILPGRSIKGVIRTAFEEHAEALRFKKEELKRLWGGEMRREVGTSKKKHEKENDDPLSLRASALAFHHAVVWERIDGELPHRMSTAIDPATGCVKDGALFAYEYLPVGTSFDIRISAEATDDGTGGSGGGTKPASPDLVVRALTAILTLIKHDMISLGGRTGSGWGRVELREEEIAYEKVSIPASTSKGNEPTRVLSSLVGKPEVAQLEPPRSFTHNHALTSIKIEWDAPSGLFVGMHRPKGIRSDEKETIAAAPLRNWRKNIGPKEDDAFLTTHGEVSYPIQAEGDTAALMLPGTSIRGVLRSRCARIESNAQSAPNSEETPLSQYLFGTTEYRGAVRVDDCEGDLSESGDNSPLKLMRNAIDRVTGSAAHGALYAELLYPHAKWKPIRIEIDHEQLRRNICQDLGDCKPPDVPSTDQDDEPPTVKNRRRAAILLLTVAVTDLCEGVLPLGGGTGGGLGFIEVSQVCVNGLPDNTSPVEIPFEAPDHPEDSRKVHEARTVFAQNILMSVISAFGENCPEATSTEHTANNLIRKWAGSESDGDQESSAAQRIRPTHVRIGWKSPTGVFVHDPQADDGNTQHPLRAKTASKKGEDSTAPLLLPGTSIRGALRSRCSRIARTVLYANNPPSQVESFTQADSDGNQAPIDIHEQLAKEPRLVRYMFGTTEYRGAVRVRDCTTKDTGPSVKVTHNAIDRWTGGAVEGLLFNEVIYPHATWNDIVIEVDTDRLLRNVRTDCAGRGLSEKEIESRARASWCLLCLALAELSAGTLPLGGKTTRGLGQVEVTGVSVSGADDVIIDAPTTERLWPTEQAEGTNAPQSAAHALLAYLRDERDGHASYTGWADYLRGPSATASDSTPAKQDVNEHE